MNDLRRELAPIAPGAWKAIDDEARSTITLGLAGRRVADFTGPLGWDRSAMCVGRAEDLASPGEGVDAKLRRVLPLAELRASFSLSRRELDAIARGAKDPDLQPVKEAARAISAAEDRAVFHGFGAAGIEGLCEAAADVALEIPDDYLRYPDVVASALEVLREAGVEGPYAIALGARCYTGLTRTAAPGGYPVLGHVEKLLDGPLIWAPAVDGAVVVSLRGGDFELIVGRDFSVGYEDSTAKEVRLYVEESFTFRVLAPEAAVPLVYAKGSTPRRKSTRKKK